MSKPSRWGWFWLIAAAPISVSAAYLALGGPAGWNLTGEQSRKLGVVSAFLVALALGVSQHTMA